MLGFRPSLQAPKDFEPRLKSVLGTQALRLMLSTPGLLKRKTVNAEDLSFSEKTTTKSENTQLFFYTFVRDEKTKELNAFAKRVVDTNKGTGTLLNKLFGVESSITFPSLTPGAYDQKKAANSQMGVPVELYDALKHSSELPYEVHQGMWNLYSKLGYEWFSKVIGLPEGDVDTVHISQRPAHEAKTDNTFRVIDNFITFVEDVLSPSENGVDTLFYFVPAAWKNQRSGLTSNGVNPNAHKQHRYLVTQTAWKNKVDLTNPDAVNKLYFHLGEALGLKGTDQQIIELLNGVDGQGGLRQEPAFQAALAAMEKARQGEELTDADKAAIVDGQDMQGLNAMLAMLEVTIAERDGLDSVEVQLPAGVDGVSNGVIKGHLILGAANSSDEMLKVMNQGGIYEVGSAYSDFAQWHDQPGNLDVYERATAEMNDRMANMVEYMPEVVNALWAVTRPLMDGDKVTSDGRKFAKGVVPPIIFGSSFENAVMRLQENFAESVLNGFTKYANKPAELDAYVKALNTLIAEGDLSAPLIPEGKDGEYHLKRNLLPAQNSAIASVFDQTLGMSMQDAVETTYGPLRRQQTALIDTANLTFNLYNAVLDGEREAALQNEDVEKNKVGEPIHDITKEADGQIKKKLKGILPVIHSLMSKRDGRIGTGMLMSRSRLVERDSPLYKNEVQFGIPVPGVVSTITWKPVSSINSTSRVTGDVVPGAAMGTMVVHSTDSADSHNVQMKHSTLNNHDELVTGVNDIGSVAQDLNKAFFQTSLEYSPLEEVYHSLRRTVEGMARLTKSEGGLSIQAQDNLVDMLAKKAWAMRSGNDVPSIGSVLVMLLKDAKVIAFQADNIRLETLSKIATVNQFAYEGQGYVVTDADRAKALKMKAELTPEVPASVVALATELTDSLKAAEQRRIKRLSDAKKAKKAQVQQVLAEAEFDLSAVEEQAPAFSPFGLFGKPRVESDKDLVKFFKSNPAATAQQVIDLLSAQGRLSPVNQKLLMLVSKVVSPDLAINLITKETDKNGVLEEPTQPSRAWFVSKGDQQAIYVLSTEFVNSGLTAESLLHELIHAAVAQVIQNPTGDAAALVAELEALRVKAQEFAKQNGLTQYTAALADVQEFVAWGMSNLGLQRDVLTKITMASKTGSNRLVTGMQKFISALTGLLFEKPDANLDNGLSVLVSNVSGLFYQASQSKPKTGDLSLSMAAMNAVNSYTTLEIHNALDSGSVSPLFQSQLANLLTGIVDALHGPFGAFAQALRETEAKTPVDAWAKAKELGAAPFGSSVLSHMAASEQEAFAIEQVEATVKAALDGKGAQATTQYRELYNLYTEIENKFSKDGSDFFKGDWAMATPSEKAHAKSQYDFVFNLKSDKSGRSDYLARFAALGLAHQGFNQMLQVATEGNVKKVRGQESFEQRLRRWFSNVLGMFRERVTKTYAGQFADNKLQSLVGQLVDIEAKKRSLLQAKKGLINTDMVEDGARAVTEGIRTKIAQAADSEFLRKQKNTAVQVVRSAVSTVTNDRTEKYIEGMQKFYERNVQSQGSVFVSLLKELTGHKEKLQAAFRAVKKFEGDRQDQIAGWAKDARKAFSKKLSKDSSASITSVVMRTGLHYLTDTMSLAEIERLVDNPVAQNRAIAELEAKLGHMKAEYVTQIKGLGYYKATELVTVEVLMMNSHLISKLAGTVYEKQITDAQAKAADPIIKQLVSLYALKYTSRTEQGLAKQVFRDENARGGSVGNGIDFVMRAQKALEAEAFERQFRNNPALMIHGFTPEILNPHTEFVVATEAEGQALIDFGYKQGAKVSKDGADPDQSQKYIYVLKGAGLAPHVSGALQFQSDTAKGTKAHSGYLNVNTQDGLENAQTQARFDQKLGSKINTDPNWDPSQEKKNYTAPLYNENGKVVNWRYMMNKQTKDDLLQRNNSFDRVLGVLGGTVFSKPKIKEQNRAVLEALKDIYKDDYALNAESYVEVGPKSNDPELRSFWERLPDQTKEDVRAVWGGDSMKVTADSLDVVFGYRKLSLADPIRQSQKNKAKLEAGGALSEADKQGLIAQNFVLSVEWALSTYARIKLGKSQDEAERYAKRAAAYLTRGERAWQEIVREIKTIYVIKGVTSMINNNKSNLTQLLASGVTLKAIREHMPDALKSAMAYQADSDELRELENLLETGYTQGNEAEIERRIVRLRNEIAINPARELIEAGLMPSIVEDVGEADDPFSYKTEFAQKTERFTDKLNPKVKEAAKFVYMTRDGKLYKALHQATQVSDFVARYVMYQHLISREQNPLSKAAAIQEAADAFVNYDIAMHRNIQFLDDMGFMMFTKYFLRMQKVLLKIGRENPARVLALAAADNYLDLGSIVLDSSALAKIGNNPFGIGALGFPGALDDLATVKAAMALVK